MGIGLGVAVAVAGFFKKHGTGGTLLQFGRQKVRISCEDFVRILVKNNFASIGKDGLCFKYDIYRYAKTLQYCHLVENMVLDDKVFFGALGYESFSCDYSSYEDPDFLLDLNSDVGVVEKKYDVVFNGGTFEHVFNPVNAFKHANSLLKVGGICVHLAPSNNFSNHGYYQFSPCLFEDYYKRSGYDILEHKIIYRKNEPSAIIADYDDVLTQEHEGTCLVAFAAKKNRECESVPLQSEYVMRWTGKDFRHYAELFRLRALIIKIVNEMSRPVVALFGFDRNRLEALFEGEKAVQSSITYLIQQDDSLAQGTCGLEVVTPQQLANKNVRVDVIVVASRKSEEALKAILNTGNIPIVF